MGIDSCDSCPTVECCLCCMQRIMHVLLLCLDFRITLQSLFWYQHSKIEGLIVRTRCVFPRGMNFYNQGLLNSRRESRNQCELQLDCQTAIFADETSTLVMLLCSLIIPYLKDNNPIQHCSYDAQLVCHSLHEFSGCYQPLTTTNTSLTMTKSNNKQQLSPLSDRCQHSNQTSNNQKHI